MALILKRNQGKLNNINNWSLLVIRPLVKSYEVNETFKCKTTPRYNRVLTLWNKLQTIWTGFWPFRVVDFWIARFISPTVQTNLKLNKQPYIWGSQGFYPC